MNREEVRIKSVVVCGAEGQPISPIVRAVVCLTTDVAGLYQAQVRY